MKMIKETENAYNDGGASPPHVRKPDDGVVAASTEFYRYHCSPEWHLARLSRTPLAGLLYSFALRISKNSGTFHGSVVGLAEYFGASRWKVQRSIAALVEVGFLVPVCKEPFQPSVYRVVAHKHWACSHPDHCAVKESFPWSGEVGDALGVCLWNASGGKVKFLPHQLAALRKTDLADDEILEAFKVLVAAEQARRKTGGRRGRWGSVQPRFLRWLTGRASADELEKLGLQPFSSRSC